jgi:hypothetical protein
MNQVAVSFFETSDTGTVANAWEEYTFDFSTINTANTYSKIVIIFDNGTVGAGGAKLDIFCLMT